MVNIKLDKVNINDLVSPSWNPRTISKKEKEKLRKSIQEYDYINPIIVNKHNNHIIGGNQRVEILKELGYNMIDVIYINEPNLDKEKALNLSLNKISGEWDTHKLEDLLVDLDLNDVDLDLTGFDNLDFKELDFDLRIKKDKVKTQKNPIIEEVIIEETNSNEETIEETPLHIPINESVSLFDSIEYEDDTVTIFGEEDNNTNDTEEVGLNNSNNKEIIDKTYEQETITNKEKMNTILNEEYKVLLTFNNKNDLENTVKKIKLEKYNCNIKIL